METREVILKKMISQSKSCFFILLLFGSYAKQPRKDSDLDMLAIVPEQKQSEIIENAIASVARTSTIRIHDTILTEKSL